MRLDSLDRTNSGKMIFFRKGLEDVITLPSPKVADIDEVQEVKRIVATRGEDDVRSVMNHDRVPFYAIQKVCEENGLRFHPDEFKEFESIAKYKGFLLVSSSPLTRSSYHADDDFKKLQDARNKQLECHPHH